MKALALLVDVVIIAILSLGFISGEHARGQQNDETIRALADHGARIAATEKGIDGLSNMKIGDRLARLETLTETNYQLLKVICGAIVLSLLKDLLPLIRKRQERSRLVSE